MELCYFTTMWALFVVFHFFVNLLLVKKLPRIINPTYPLVEGVTCRGHVHVIQCRKINNRMRVLIEVSVLLGRDAALLADLFSTFRYHFLILK
jgi:hypothetical protein